MKAKKIGIVKVNQKDRKAFIARTVKDTVVSFKLEGIDLTEEEAYEMAEEAVVKAEKAGQLVFA